MSQFEIVDGIAVPATKKDEAKPEVAAAPAKTPKPALETAEAPVESKLELGVADA